jgi:hypothetical protein
MVYKWRFYQYSVDANTVGETIHRIEAKHGECTAKLLLEEARGKKSPIHELFEWDDTVAAEKYRLKQATDIITAIAVVMDDNKEEAPMIRAFANVGAKNDGSFISMHKALSSEESRRIVLSHALDELKAFKAKYVNLKEFIKIFSEITELEKNLIDG